MGGSTAPGGGSTAHARQKAVFEAVREVVPLGGGSTAVWGGSTAPGRRIVPETRFWPIWAEKLTEKLQIGGEINGIWPWERKVSKINKFSNRSTDENLLKRTRFTDRFKIS